MHPIFLHITGYGWSALGLLLLAIIITAGILKRRGGPKAGCATMGYIGLVVFAILSLTAGLTAMLSGFVYDAFTLPRYQARVVNHDTYMSKSTDNGRTRYTRMYQPIVVFRDRDGRELQLKSDVSSSSPESIGATLTVGYKPGMDTVSSFSAGKYLLVGGGFVMLLALVYCTIAGIAYAGGARMQKISRAGINILIFFFFPLAMLGFIGALGYATIAYFMGDKPDMPLWALAVCIFFLLVLIPSFIAYVRLLVSKRRLNP